MEYLIKLFLGERVNAFIQNRYMINVNTQLAFVCSSQRKRRKYQKNMLNVFKENNKDARLTFLCSFIINF